MTSTSDNLPDPPPRRGKGRPPAGESVFSDEDLEKIGEWLAEGKTATYIARRLGVHHSTAMKHIKSTILPALRSPALRGPEAMLNSLEHMFRRCWECFNSELPAEIRSKVKQVLTKDGEQLDLEETVKILRPQQAEWLKLALDVLREKMMLLRYRSDTTINVLRFDSSDQEFRVAGATVGEIDKYVAERIRKLLIDQVQYEKALEQQGLLPRQLKDGKTLEQDDGD